MDAAEFKRLFLPCHPKLYRVAFRLTGNAQDAEDIVQEAYLKLWMRRDESGVPDCPEAYAVALTRNLCLDLLRQRWYRAAECPPEEAALATEETPSRLVEEADERACLQRLIGRLPDTQRQVMWLRDVNGCSFEEMEHATGLSATNLRVLLSRARKKIREQLNRMNRL